MKVALLGSTGLVGKNVLPLLAQLDEVESVYCPVRSVPDLAQLGAFENAPRNAMAVERLFELCQL